MPQLDLFEGSPMEGLTLDVATSPGAAGHLTVVHLKVVGEGGRHLKERHLRWVGAMPELLPDLARAVSEAYLWGDGPLAVMRAFDGMHKAAGRHQKSVMRQVLAGLGEGR